MQKYQVKKRIAEGAFGVVYEGEKVNEKGEREEFAIKQVCTSKNIEREISILKTLPYHPNIVKVYDVVIKNNVERSIVMEKGKFDLATLIDSYQYPIQQNIVRVVARGVLRGLKHLKQNKIVHRDLKPSNILVKQSLDDILICDFGSAVPCTQGEDYELQGFTQWYKCPEMLFGSRNYQYEVDVWSLGCVLMELACGEPLFAGKSQFELLALIGDVLGDPCPENWPSIVKLNDYGKILFGKKAVKSMEQISEQKGISLQLCRFLMRMIKYEGRSRVEELLQDPFLKEEKGTEIELGIFGGRKIKGKIFN